MSARTVKQFQSENKNVEGTTRQTYMLPKGKCDMSEVDKMAYYDLKTNEIWAESNIEGFHDEHIEIDEVIAPLIRELNIKGYKTKFCCSGHPFYSLCEAMVDSEETAKAFVGLIGTERTENPRVPVRALYVMPDNDFYITFEENEQKTIVLALPDGFEWDDERTIRYTYNNYEFYAFLSERAKAAKALHDWATQLPPVA